MAILRQYGWQIVLVILAFGFVFSILGVYDTYALPFYMRLTFWTATMATGLLATILIMPILVKRILNGHHPIVQVFIGSCLASVPVTLVITVFNPTFSFESSLKIWALQFGYVLIISLIVAGVAYPFLKKIGAYGEVETEKRADVKTFLKRLPLKYHDADLYGFSAEDHYLRVYSDKGEELILLRFADALRELMNVDGLQVHRSWWVATSAVEKVETRAGKKILVLKSGTKVPVSRTYMQNAKEAFSF